jgi:hypothetical protein
MYFIVKGDPLGGFPAWSVWLHNIEESFDAENVFDDANMGTEYEDHMDPFLDVQQ